MSNCTATQTTVELKDCNHLDERPTSHARECLWLNEKWQQADVVVHRCEYPGNGNTHSWHGTNNGWSWKASDHGAQPHVESDPYEGWMAGAYIVGDGWVPHVRHLRSRP